MKYRPTWWFVDLGGRFKQYVNLSTNTVNSSWIRHHNFLKVVLAEFPREIVKHVYSVIRDPM